MKVSSRVMVVWAITVFLLIGAVFIVITLIRGDDTDMERQPEGAGETPVGSQVLGSLER